MHFIPHLLILSCVPLFSVIQFVSRSFSFVSWCRDRLDTYFIVRAERTEEKRTLNNDEISKDITSYEKSKHKFLEKKTILLQY